MILYRIYGCGDPDIVYVWSVCMYLLMLLATFISAIYGYNLSARPDYDREIARKKAMGVVYKFIFQELNASKLAEEVTMKTYKNAKGLEWVLSGDKIYSDFRGSGHKTNDTGFVYDTKSASGSSTKIVFPRRQKDISDADGIAKKNYLGTGRHFYDGSDMVSKIMCLDKPLHENDAQEVPPITAEAGEGTGIIGSLCTNSPNRFFITYKKLDARWVNRVHKGISLDFMRAIIHRRYSDNIGVISWDENDEVWKFQGKINFDPVYAQEKKEYEDKWKEEHPDGPLTDDRFYPFANRNRTVWTLPKVFTENYFTDKDGNNICDRGCLFRIRYL